MTPYRAFVLCSFRYKVFASSFPALHEQYPQALRSLREQLITKLETAVKDEAEKMYSDHGIVPLLNQLEELSKQKRPGVTAWRPTGDVEEDLRAHTYPLKLKQRDRLKKIAEALTEENKQLRTAVEARRHKFHNTQQAVEDNIARVNQAYDACQNLPLQKLIDFVKKECM
ncbi:polyamine-modulated factor 1-like [Liolophura sinensis]|uniref:polyamine-modulated factor 1-like n=1 Tax=Liolophura sinensis TaxID=3198878 RepID=UPI0031589044